MDKVKPLFIWAGGKNKMLKHYAPFFPNSSNYSHYVEPFFGGGAMFLHLKKLNPNLKCTINDLNKDIIQIYLSIQNFPKEFISIVDDLEMQYLPLSKENRKTFFFKIRNEHAWNYSQWSKIEESAILYFLMRTCFNGIFQLNKNTNGRFGTPAGLLTQTNSIYSKSNVLEWHYLLQDTVIMTGDWRNVVDTVNWKDTFFFFDPPYRGGFTSYGQTFTDKDQADLLKKAKMIDENGGIVFFSNRDIGDDFWIDRGNLDLNTFDVTYTAGRRKHKEGKFFAMPAKEILLHSKVIKEELNIKNVSLEALFG